MKAERILSREDILSLGESAGETLLRHYCQAVEAGETPSQEVLTQLAEMFQQVLHGGDIQKALAIKRRKGRHATDGLGTAYLVAKEMEARRKRGQAAAYEAAVEAVAEQTRQSVRTVRRHYGRSKNLVAWYLRIEKKNLTR